MRTQRWIPLLSLLFLLAGCGSSNDNVNPISGAPAGPNAPLTISGPISASAGGSLVHPTGHRVDVDPNGVRNDTIGSLTLIDSATLTARNEREFDPAGTGVRLDLPSTNLVGRATFSIPYATDRPQQHALYWHLPGGLLVPLQTTYQAGSGTFQGTVDLSESELLLKVSGQVQAQTSGQSITVSVVDEAGWFGRPPHVDWPSYNLYVFQNGSFNKIVDQGVAQGTIPAPGANPLMVVHGLGSDIPRFEDAATYFASQNSFTNIYGYEYDTLSAIATTGPRLNTAYNLVETNPNSVWSHLGHSMGTLISRTAFEAGTTPPYASNSVVFAAGPHLGSTVINKLQSDLGLFDRFVRYLVVNEVMNFTNADGTPCKVDITDAGFSDLAQGSAALNALNTGAATKHPEETYRTVGGNDPGLEFDAADFILGIYPDDGLVFLTSANPGSLIGAVDASVVPESHTSIVNDTVNSLPLILSELTTH